MRATAQTPTLTAVFYGLTTLLLSAMPAQRATPSITYATDVAPILQRNCVGCHRPEGDAPFSLLTFTEVSQRASLIAEVTSRRIMPPWKPEPGHGDFLGGRRLTDAEITTIRRWSVEGAREGASVNAPLDWPPPSAWQLGPPDLVLALPEYKLRADGPDVFRHFVVTVPGQGTRFVRAWQLRPSSRAVHHANVRLDPTLASRRLDEADPAPGYEGLILRSADFPDGHFLGWTPGQAPPIASADLAWRLTLGSDLVVQLHMQPTGKPERVGASIGLYFTDVPPSRTPVMIRLGRQTLDIPAGAATHHVRDSYRLPVDVDVHAIQPHAHWRARDVRAWATLPDRSRRDLLWIADWDFRWQDHYRYRTPVSLPAGTLIEMAYLFDNSASNPRNPDRPPRRVEWGWRSSDEMADVWIQVIPRSTAERIRLADDVRPKMLTEDAAGCEVLIAREPRHVSLRNDAGVIYLGLGQSARALTHFEAASRLDPGSAVGRYNVGVALEALGRVSAAVAAYEEALRLDPGYSAAHNNLGNLQLSSGDLTEATRHYRRAVEIDPANIEARRNLGVVLLTAGDGNAAEIQFAEALSLRPDWPPLLTSVAWLRAASRDPRLRRPEEAMRFAEQAAALAPTDARALDVLAVAYAASGRFDEAMNIADRAATAAIDAGLSELARQIRDRRALYRERKPFLLP